MKIILLITLLSVYAFTSLAEGSQNSSIYDKVKQNDVYKKPANGLFDQEYDASKIKHKSRMQQANKKLLDGKISAQEIEEEAKKKYGEEGLKASKKVQHKQKDVEDQIKDLDKELKKKKGEQK